MRAFSRATQTYILGIIIFACSLAVWQFHKSPLEGAWLLLATGIIASLLQGIAVFGTTARSTYSLSWIVYAFTLILIGPAAVFTIVFISHLSEWLLDRDRLKWYIQAFNVSTFFIGFTLSDLIITGGRLLLGDDDAFTFWINLAALAAFTLLNHFLVAWVVKLARGQSFSESGIFGGFTLLLDFTLLCLGYASAIIWQASPVALILIAFVAYILYQALNIPALERKSEVDPKTELFNARYFTQALDEEMVRAKRFKRPLSLIMADLDLLRNINNTYGHLAGDAVLQGIARIFQEMTRDFDVVARFGGEEFAALLPETTPEDAYIVAERVRRQIEATEFDVTTSVKPIRATMSFGIAGLEGKKQTADNLIHNADVALYRAKETGRNRVCGHDDALDSEHATSHGWGKIGVSVHEIPKSPLIHNHNGHKTTLPPEAAPAYIPEPVSERQTDATAVSPSPTSAARRAYPAWATTAFIAVLASSTLLLAVHLLNISVIAINWTNFLFFAIVVLLMESAAIEIYMRDSSISTSAALLVAGVLLFGPIGAILLGVIISFVAFARRRTPISRFIFNASNHTLGGLLIAGLILLHDKPVEDWSLIYLLMMGAVAGCLIYLSTTIFLTIAIGLSDGRSFKEIWIERFRWLAFYYLALGVIAAALVLSYLAIGLTGILIVALPLLLLRYSQKQYIDHTEKLVHNLQQTNAQLSQQSEEITLLNEELLLTLARSLDLRDPYVVEHSKHVARYAVYIAEELGLPQEQIESIRKAGLLHDIGKLGVREEILFKPCRLTAEEFEIVKEHAVIGADLVRGCHSLEPLAPFVLHHHEYFNGQGYPHALVGQEIPLEARILSVSDAVEAMASDRPYKKAMSPAAILAEVQRCAGAQFDPQVAAAFARVIERQGESVIINSARNVLARQQNDQKTYAPHY